MYLRLEENTKERKKTQEKWGIYIELWESANVQGKQHIPMF
jgi:hypothetical protein